MIRPPVGWELIAPADAQPGDSILLPWGEIRVLDERMFEAFHVELRRLSWAVRKVGE